MTQSSLQTAADFPSLGISPVLLKFLAHKKFMVPTPIQSQAIPAGLEGKDIVGIAQTGTGKTMAFGIPMVQRLSLNEEGNGLILVPTRELAEQVAQSLEGLAGVFGMKLAVLIGGVPYARQYQMMRQGPRIIIATPGRLNDHLKQKTISLDKVSILVLDEADHMFDMGFRPQIATVLKLVPKERQTLLFSATMPTEIMDLARSSMKLPLRIEVAPAGTAAAKIAQEVFVVQKAQKIPLLLAHLQEYRGTILIFSRTKHGAKKLTEVLNAEGHKTAELHANRSLGQRREALEGFKRGKYRVLVATDIASRGIDVEHISLVINFDLPDASEDYVHRIGRTARAGREGKAISFATPDQMRDIRQIESLMRLSIPRKDAPKSMEGPRNPVPVSSLPSNESRRPEPRQVKNGFHGASKSRGFNDHSKKFVPSKRNDAHRGPKK